MPVTVPVHVPEAIRALAQPFLSETVQLFRHVSMRDLDALADLCDDDFGIVDLDTTGASVDIRTRADWIAWFEGLFATLEGMGADTWTEIDEYDVLPGTDLSMSVVRFTQVLAAGETAARFGCVATIVWKRDGDRWREARWHVSLLQPPPPDGS